MGSTSGTRAGERDTVPGALFGDTIPVPVPVPVPAAGVEKNNSQTSAIKRHSERTKREETNPPCIFTV